MTEGGVPLWPKPNQPNSEGAEARRAEIRERVRQGIVSLADVPFLLAQLEQAEREREAAKERMNAYDRLVPGLRMMDTERLVSLAAAAAEEAK